LPNRTLLPLLFAYLAIAIGYLFATPIFEPSDELWHYPVVREIAEGRGLPVQQVGVKTTWEQEGSQPPLYYVIAAGLTAWVDGSDYEQVAVRNPFAKLGIPGTPDNINTTRHPPQEWAIWHGTHLAVRIIRLFSILLGGLTVFCTAQLAWVVTRNRWVAVLSAAFVAFNPMFLFIASSVNNDNLLISLSTLTLWWVLAGESVPTWRKTSGLGILLGLAALTKLSGLMLAPTVGLAIALRAWRAENWQWQALPRVGGRVLLRGAVLAGILLAVCGWWFWRNHQLYAGDWLGLETMVAIAGARPTPPGIAQLWSEWQSFWYSYWGVFGAFNVLMPRLLYPFYAILSVGALLLAVARLFQTRAGRAYPFIPPLVLTVFTLLTFIGLVRWTSLTMASQGRLMFGAIAALSLGMAWGWLAWLPARWQKQVAGLGGIALAICAASVPFVSLQPAYAIPTALAQPQLPASAQALDVRFANGIHLLGYQLQTATILPSQGVRVTLYWQSEQALTNDINLALNVFGRTMDGTPQNVGKLDTWHGGGRLPTSLWQVGAVYADSYQIPLFPTAQAPAQLRLSISLWEKELAQTVAMQDGQGQILTSLLIDAGALQESTAQVVTPSTPANARFGNAITLLGYDLPARVPAGATVPLTLYWQAEQALPSDYTLFIQLWASEPQAGQLPLLSADAPPLAGEWGTRFWQVGFPLTDARHFTLPKDLPAGEYTLWLGWYFPSTGERLLPVSLPDGTQHPDGAMPLPLLVE
jgi:4-amino-4-deoxy-L-arabinose transferase-like glycosyltransferase